MVAYAKSLMIIAAIAAQASAWKVQFTDAASCDPIVEGSSGHEGDSGETSECRYNVFTGPRTMRVEEWDAGCEVHVYKKGHCEGISGDEDPAVWERPDSYDEDVGYHCIGKVGSRVGVTEYEGIDVQYVCN